VKTPKAILFDFDGVLAQTMEDNCAAWQAVFKQQGVDLVPEEYFQLEGSGMRQMAVTIAARHGLSESLAPEIMAAKDDYYSKHNSFHFYPGIEEFIVALSGRGLRLGLVTGCHYRRLSETVPQSFLSQFQAVIHGDSGCKHKPDPEPYQKAMNILAVGGADSLVIENAPLGIRAAKEAGAYCLAIETTLPKQFLKEADEIVHSHRKLYERLAEMTNSTPRDLRI
jgi:HAD superfamily hydrolase (TIGR01509 family)